MAKKPSETAAARAAAPPWRLAVDWLRRWGRSARQATARVAVGTRNRLAERLRRRHLCIEVLVVDRGRRRRIVGQVRAAVRQLRRAAATAPVTGIVVCERVAASGRDLAGATHVCRRADGGQTALIRLALTANGRRRRDDEVLAVLAEQWLGLAQQEGASVLVPIELPLVPETPAAVGAGTPDGRLNSAAGRPADPLEPAGPARQGPARTNGDVVPFPLQRSPNGSPFGPADVERRHGRAA